MVLESGDVITDRNNVEQRISLDRDKGISLDSNAGSVTWLKVVRLNFIIRYMQKILVLTSEDYWRSNTAVYVEYLYCAGLIIVPNKYELVK